MKTIKILILTTVCLCANIAIMSQNTRSITKFKVNTTWKDNSREFELIESFSTELNDNYQVANDYTALPDFEECWMIKNIQEYNLISKNPKLNSAVFDNYNLFITSTSSSGCKLPLAQVSSYSDGKGNKNILYIFITPQSLCKNGLFVTLTFLVPKKNCSNISDIICVKKMNYELMKRNQESTQNN